MDEEPALLPCADKLAFETEVAALGSAATVRYQHGTKVKPYICQYCGLWHLASEY